MKILFFIDSLHSGGKERRLVELIKGLKNIHPQIEMELVLTKVNVHYDEIFETGIKIHYTIRKLYKKDPLIFLKFYKIAKAFKPDIIHVWGNMVAIYAIPTKVWLRIPMVNNQITEVPLKIQKGILSHRLSFRFSDRIISNSKAGLYVFNAPKNKSNCIYNGFDFNRIQNLEPVALVKKRYNLNSKIVIGMFASFSNMKDYSSYIDAAIKLSILYENIIFIAVGSGNSKGYEEMVPLDLKDRILFLGQQNNVESIMNCCDIGVLASFTEGISNAILELMALGKPVVVSGGGGSSELVINGKNGFLIPSKDSDLLAQKIGLLLNDDKVRIEMGINAKQSVANNFSIDLMIRKFYNEYKQLCAE